MTLAELVVGMVLLSIVALAVSGLTMSLSDAYAGGERFYDSLQEARVSMLRIEAEVRKAKMLLSDDPLSRRSFALWQEDRNDNDRVEVSELTVYRYTPGSSTLVRQTFSFPPGSEFADMSLSPSVLDNPGMVWLIAEWLKPYRQDAQLCHNLTACEFIADNRPPDSELFSVRMQAGESGKDVQLQTAVSLKR
jgi:hypothetical protein